ncbi:MAG TPA: hypothetical protein VM889_02045 [Candidatus Thermoplasmatota archaeon]|nr:hypothetical protein [Candidatus Thermoplasmatota archaeon]
MGPAGRKPASYDLAFAAFVAAAAGIGIVITNPVSMVAAAVLLAWATGFLVIETVWPGRAAPVHGRVERHALAVGFSLVVPPLVAAALHVAGSLDRANFTLAFGLVFIGLWVSAALRRARGPSEQIAPVRPARVPLAPRERALTIVVLVLGIAAVAAVGAKIAATTDPAPLALHVVTSENRIPLHPHNVTDADSRILFAIVDGGPIAEDVVVVARITNGTWSETRTLALEPGARRVAEFVLPDREPGPAWMEITATGAATGETRALRILVRYGNEGP